ncbi:MAG: peptidylprolyl isomerase [Calditrichaceae bacterium]|nr:peptidylprolyl isomerase [Calditrichaceae bacterium]MBN2708464.1 peptidylprolyl isomerase [Calditrichaceae bacterium]
MKNATIPAKEFITRYTNLVQSTGIKDTRSSRLEALKHLISEKILIDLQDNSEYLNQPHFIEQLNQIKREVLLAFYKKKEIYNKIDISENELREAYVRINEKISARHLFTRSENEAWEYYNSIMNGVTFEQLAPLVFSDDSLANNGGYLGYFTWGDMESNFEDAVFSMKPGEISKPVQTSYGYSIIKVEDRFKSPILTEHQYQIKKDKLRRLVLIQKMKQNEKKFINQLEENLKITINDSILELLSDALSSKTIAFSSSSHEISKFQYSNEILVRSSFNDWTIEETILYLSEIPLSARLKIKNTKFLKAAIKGLVIQKYLLKDAEKKGYGSDEEVEEMIKEWSRTKLYELKIKNIVESSSIDSSYIYEYYKEHKAEFITDDLYNIQEILLETKHDADIIQLKLKNGENFDNLAKKYSIRPNADHTLGISGYLPITRFGILKEGIKNSVIGKVNGPFNVSGNFVFYKVLDNKKGAELKFQEIKDGILAILRQTYQRQHFDSYFKNLIIEHNVKIDSAYLFSVKI